MTSIWDQPPYLVLLSGPTFDADVVIAALQSEGLEWRRTPGATPAEELIEMAGRVCYMSFAEQQSPRSNSEYIRNLIAQGHESVLEHAAWTFLLRGVSRSFSHQIVRHRAGFSFSQMSQQYTDQSMVPVRVPSSLLDSERLQSLWLQAIESSHATYREILAELEAKTSDEDAMSDKERRRAIRSAARSVLPEATETRIVFSANARALRHFLRTRGGIIGDEEMRLVAALVLGEMRKEAPSVFADFEIVEREGLPLVKYTGDGGP